METKFEFKVLKKTPCDSVDTVYSAPTIELLISKIKKLYPYLCIFPKEYTLKSFVEKYYSGWFQIIEEPEYPKILKLKNITGACSCDFNKKNNCDDTYCVYYKVAISETESLTIGDHVESIENPVNHFKIKSFYYSAKNGNDNTLICREDIGQGNVSVMKVQKVKEPEQKPLMFGDKEIMLRRIYFSSNDVEIFVKTAEKNIKFLYSDWQKWYDALQILNKGLKVVNSDSQPRIKIGDFYMDDIPNRDSPYIPDNYISIGEIEGTMQEFEAILNAGKKMLTKPEEKKVEQSQCKKRDNCPLKQPCKNCNFFKK